MREQCERPQRDIIMVACHYCSICSRLTGGDMVPVVHFEMFCDDRDRMARVYQAVFKWDTAGLGADMGRYVLAATTESDRAGPKRPGAINGDSCKDNFDWPAQHPGIVIAFEHIREAMLRVTDN